MFGYFVIAIINTSRAKAETTILSCFSSKLHILESIVIQLIIVYCLYESHLCDSLSHTLCAVCAKARCFLHFSSYLKFLCWNVFRFYGSVMLSVMLKLCFDCFIFLMLPLFLWFCLCPWKTFKYMTIDSELARLCNILIIYVKLGINEWIHFK